MHTHTHRADRALRIRGILARSSPSTKIQIWSKHLSVHNQTREIQRKEQMNLYDNAKRSNASNQQSRVFHVSVSVCFQSLQKSRNSAGLSKFKFTDISRNIFQVRGHDQNVMPFRSGRLRRLEFNAVPQPGTPKKREGPSQKCNSAAPRVSSDNTSMASWAGQHCLDTENDPWWTWRMWMLLITCIFRLLDQHDCHDYVVRV